MTLAEFLTARYKKDEAGWRAVAARDLDTRVTMLRGKPLAPRMLADVDAKRRIVAEYERGLRRRRDHPGDLASAGAVLALHAVAQLLALPYADHEDFDEDWRV